MKLSEMNTDQMAQAMCDMGKHVENICMDDNINLDLKRLSEDMKEGRLSVLKMLGRTIGIWLPALLKTHKEDVYAILSVLTGKSAQEIAQQNGMETIKEARECLDKELTDFFSLFVGMV